MNALQKLDQHKQKRTNLINSIYLIKLMLGCDMFTLLEFVNKLDSFDSVELLKIYNFCAKLSNKNGRYLPYPVYNNFFEVISY